MAAPKLSASQNVNLSFKVSLTPAADFDAREVEAAGLMPVFDAKGRKPAKIIVGGQAFNLLLSKTTTWEPTGGR